ncbi:hypothetical protein [Catenuloplanes indicus]|uniref:Uncharacterized protein n=1 Tax=Catenuloplanes indicus TaxID=137267 RepID=A0AAE4B1U1_9ACTN|nr:hypothetical protein [Catenuloplanes indicus]MDQ0370967.1 hypothetical protein [Catenuloplanes indicus]
MKLSTLAAAATLATVALTSIPSPAAAFGQETFGCRVSPGPVVPFTPVCTNLHLYRNVQVGFLVDNLSGSYTFSWNVTGPYSSVVSGCTATSASCAVAVSAVSDMEIVAWVTYSQNGQTASKRASATINAVCAEFC